MCSCAAFRRSVAEDSGGYGEREVVVGRRGGVVGEPLCGRRHISTSTACPSRGGGGGGEAVFGIVAELI